MATAPASTVASLTTPAPTTSADARRLADTLAEQESSLARSQREARNAAQFAKAKDILDMDAPRRADERDRAQILWNVAADDPKAGLDILFEAFINMRTASAVRAAVVSQASGVMSQTKPLRNENSGQEQAYRSDTADSLLRAEFGDAVEDVIRSRVDHAAGVARNATQERCASAGDAAAAKVK